jgi:hypothetical protein
MELDKDVKYIAEGSFGCVFSSKVQCKNENKDLLRNNSGFVSKVSVSSSDDNLNREIMLGQRIIDGVSQYDYYFAPILKSCSIDIGMIEDDEIKKCDLVSNDKKSNEKDYISSTLKYIGRNSVCEYLDSEKKNSTHIKKILESHLHLILGLEKLLSMEDPIIHYDLKNGNIMYDESYNVPIMIDFGLSYTRSELFSSPMNLEALDKIFYVYYEKYSAWNIDVVLLSYITQEIAIKEEININSQILKPYYENLIQVVDDFIEGSEMFETEEERELFSKDTKEYLSLYYKKTINTLIDGLRNKWKTWDNYSIAAMFYLYLQNNKALYENKYAIPYKKMLKEIIYSTPKFERQEPKKTRETIVSFTRM